MKRHKHGLLGLTVSCWCCSRINIIMFVRKHHWIWPITLCCHIIVTWEKTCRCPLRKKKSKKWGGRVRVRVTASGLWFGVWCDGVYTWQSYHITTMSLVTCNVQPGPTLALLIQEQHRHDIRSCLLLICLGISDYLSINTKQPVTSLQLEGGSRSWMQLCS